MGVGEGGGGFDSTFKQVYQDVFEISLEKLQ